MRILLIEDERRLSDAVAQILKKNNYTVDAVYNGEDGLDYSLSGVYDIILLDIMLPKMNGLDILRSLREKDKTTPVILLTARGEVSDKILGLNIGADDYLPKPFHTDELIARIRAVTRRRGEIASQDNSLEYGDIKLDTSILSLSSSKNEVTLTSKEYELLEYFINNKNIILSKDKIIEKVWGFDSEAMDNHVEVYISFLRKKLLYVESKVMILTIRGVGYRICFGN